MALSKALKMKSPTNGNRPGIHYLAYQISSHTIKPKEQAIISQIRLYIKNLIFDIAKTLMRLNPARRISSIMHIYIINTTDDNNDTTFLSFLFSGLFISNIDINNQRHKIAPREKAQIKSQEE